MGHGPLSHVLRHIRTLAGGPVPGAPTDGDLLRRFAGQRDEAAFAALMQRHGPMVLAVCRRMLHDWHDAEDAYQATFLVLARKAGASGWQASIGCWLYAVAQRVAAKAREAAARRRQRQTDMVDVPCDEPTDAAWQELRPLLDDELSRLPEKYRAPLVLCYLEGKTNEDAAQQLGWPVGSVWSGLSRGRDLLRRRLERRGLALSVGACAALVTEKGMAAVPAALAQVTLHAATSFAAGQAAAVSAEVANLSEGALRHMETTRLKLAATLAVSVIGLGVGVIAYGLQSQPPFAAFEQDALSSAPAGEPAKERGQPLTLRHGGEVLYLAFAADGKTVTSCGADGMVRAWSAETGEEVGHFKAGWTRDSIQPFALSADCRTLASCDEGGTVWLWDASGIKRRGISWLAEVPAKERAQADRPGLARCVALSADGKSLVAADGPTVRLWDADSGKAGHVFRHTPNPKAPLHAENVFVALSPDKKHLAAVQSGPPGFPQESDVSTSTLCVWEVATGKERFKATEEWTAWRMAAFSPNGKMLAIGGDGDIRVWEVGTAQERCRITAKRTECVAFASDQRTLVTVERNRVSFWELGRGKRLGEIKLDGLPIGCLAAGPTGNTWAAGKGNGMIVLWDMAGALASLAR
jgi:RNA polymerase sigma factor (sigma-70 family)